MRNLTFLATAIILTTTTIFNAQAETTDTSKMKKSHAVVYGHVADHATGEELKYANVTLYNSNNEIVTGGLTDNLGYYIINNVPVDDYTLVVSYLGYSDSKVVRFSVNSDKTRVRVKHIKMQPEPYTMEAVNIVYVSGHDEADQMALRTDY